MVYVSTYMRNDIYFNSLRDVRSTFGEMISEMIGVDYVLFITCMLQIQQLFLYLTKHLICKLGAIVDKLFILITKCALKRICSYFN